MTLVSFVRYSDLLVENREIFIPHLHLAPCSGDPVGMRPFYITANKEQLIRRKIIFRCVNSLFLQLYCLKFSFTLANISRKYEENKTALFSVHVVCHITQ